MEIKFLKKTEEIFNLLYSSLYSSEPFTLEEILKKCFLISLYSEFEFYLISLLFFNFREGKVKVKLFDKLKKDLIKKLDFNGLKKIMQFLGYDADIAEEFKSFWNQNGLIPIIEDPNDYIRWNDFIENRHSIAHAKFEIQKEFTKENLKILLYFAEFILQEIEKIVKEKEN